MFKSDVFSTGLVLFQLSAMMDVGGFNQKTEHNDGEELIKKGLKEILDKMNTLNQNVSELSCLRIPYGEQEAKYEELAKYISQATSIQALIKKEIKH